MTFFQGLAAVLIFILGMLGAAYISPAARRPYNPATDDREDHDDD